MTEKKKLAYGSSCWIIFAIIMLAFLDNKSWIHIFDHFGYSITQPTLTWKTQLLKIVTSCGDPIVLQILTIILMLLLWWQKKMGASLWYGALQFVGYLLVIGVKYSVTRARPSNRLVHISGYSFPSGHTFATTIFTLTIVTLLWPHLRKHWLQWLVGLIASLFIILVMVSRVYLRAHYATDVSAGFFLALGWWLIANAEKQRFYNWLVKPIYDSFFE